MDKHPDNEPDLYLIELPGDGTDGARYVICERFFDVDPKQSAMGIPWEELARMFQGHTLRAVPFAGKSAAGSLARRIGGVSTGPGVSTVQVNIGKIETND